MSAEVITTDLLVVGGGGAAARAALEARKLGAKVLLVTKGSFGAIGTRGAGATASANSEFGIFATPGWEGPLSDLEQPLTFKFFQPHHQAYENIIQIGLGMAEPRLARILVEEAVEARSALIDIGVSFGEWGIRSHGVSIMGALGIQLRKTGVSIRERMMVAELIIQDGECLGAMAIDENRGEIIFVKAGATVLATGGDANLFLLNLNPPDNTGDGYALGYNAGAELMNMEFRQIMLGTVYPTRNMLIRSLNPSVKLKNSEGKEFLKNYLPDNVSAEECLAQRQLHNPFSTRDTLSRYVDVAIIREVMAGRGTEHNGVYMECPAQSLSSRASQRDEFWSYRGIDFTKGPVEIGVCHHSSLGGLRIDERARTTVPYLYAAGEVAAGPHGADRIGGHMLLASQVFGARAGRYGAEESLCRRVPEIRRKVISELEGRMRSILGRKGDHKPRELKKMLQEAAYFNMLVVKTNESLTRLLNEVRKVEEGLFPRLSVRSPKELIEALELQHMLTLAEIEARVCLERTESRGSHFREDYPERDDSRWLRSIIVKRSDGGPKLEAVCLDPSWTYKGDEKVKMWG